METSKHVEKLRDILNQHFGWNKARITCFTKMIIGLFVTRTVNLTEIAAAFEGQAKLLSRYRRLQRFFSGFIIDYEVIAKFIFKLFNFENKIYLTMDRTNWQWGKKNINILMIAVVYKGIAIPLVWKLLDKKGNSNTSERIEIMEIFIKWFGKDCIAGLLADREFIGKDWFKWLIKENISFYIRLKDHYITTNSRGLEVDVCGLFWDIKPMEQRTLKGKRRLWGNEVYLSGSKNQSNELMIIATNDNPDKSIDTYLKRWQIETLFGCLKGRGFNFEDTHITDLTRIKKMIALLAIAFCWAHRTGEWRHEEVEPILIKKHGRPAYSLFRYGLNYIRESFYQITINADLFANCLSRLLFTSCLLD